MGGSAAAPSGTRYTFSVDDVFGDSDDDDDEDDFNPLAIFLRQAHFRTAPFSASIPAMAVLPMATAAVSAPIAPPRSSHPVHQQRSYAIDDNDRTAGSNPANPLEIDDDSDDSSEVQVVEVARRGHHQHR
jgi:hypothetical protein